MLARNRHAAAALLVAGLAVLSSWAQDATPALSVDPATPVSNLPLRVTMRFNHIGYYVARTSHEIAGNVVRIHQNVVYVGPVPTPDPVSQAVITHDVGALAPGNYTIEWRQTTYDARLHPGQGDGVEQLVATLPVTVLFGGPCGSCAEPDKFLALDRVSIAFDAFPLGITAGTQSITVSPQAIPSGFEPPPSSSMYVERIWTDNGDYLISHDCPMSPMLFVQGQTCTVTLKYNPTLHGESPGHLFVRFSTINFGAGPYVKSAALSGRALSAPSINFIPPPTTPDTAVEYYAASLNHYFFTPSPAEQALVDSGFAGAWQRTGVTFRVGGPTDVCRFYGDPAGPNSHFYTGSASECAQLRALDAATPPGRPAWRYEGIGLKAEVPVGVIGIDPPLPPPNRPWCRDENSRAPIYRLYNDGFDKHIDSNHRHVPSRGTFPAGKSGEDIVREMMAAGWIYEGNALCN